MKNKKANISDRILNSNMLKSPAKINYLTYDITNVETSQIKKTRNYPKEKKGQNINRYFHFFIVILP